MSINRTLYTITSILGVFSLVFLASYPAYAAIGGINQQVPYIGKILNADNTYLADGNYRARIILYDAPTGGVPQFQENRDGVTVYGVTTCPLLSIVDGRFDLLLGSCNDAIDTILNNTTLYLELQLDINNDSVYEEIFTPRRRLGAAPAAINALRLIADGNGLSTNTLSINDAGNLLLPNGNFGLGVAVPNYRIEVGSSDISVYGIRLGRGSAAIDSNTVAGFQTLNANTTGYNTVAIGYQSLLSNTEGYNNTGIGYRSLYSNTTGVSNVAVGTSALRSNSIGSNNVAVGVSALLTNLSGGANVAVGDQALTLSLNGGGNVAVGHQVLGVNVSGNYNVGVGFQTLLANIIGDYNVAVGNQALRLNTGTGNVALGANAAENSTGSSIVAVGRNALQANTSGSQAVAVGFAALRNNTIGDSNVAIGNEALFSNLSGNTNTAIGYRALYDVTSGSNNIVVGYNSGLGIVDGSANVILGSNVSGLTSSLSNTIILADGSGNQRIRIDSSGNVGIAKTFSQPISHKLDIQGGISVGDGSVAFPITSTAYQQSGAYIAFRDGDNTSDTLREDYIGYKENTFTFTDTPNGLDTTEPDVVIKGRLGVGISAFSPAYALEVGNSGDGTEARANAWNTFSDSRYKKDITPIDSSLDKVLRLNGYYYYWKSGIDNSRQIGYIAQEVQNILPEVVSSDNQGYLSLDYGKITPILVEAIKSLNTKINTQSVSLVESLSKQSIVLDGLVISKDGNIEGNLTVKGNLIAKGGVQYNEKTINTSIRLTDIDQYISADLMNSTENIQIVLPGTLPIGQEIFIKKVDSSSNMVEIVAENATIDGETIYRIINQYDGIRIIKTKSGWYVVGKYISQ